MDWNCPGNPSHCARKEDALHYSPCILDLSPDVGARTLFRLALDKEVLLRIRQYSQLEKSTCRPESMENAPHLDQETAISILSHLKNRIMKDTLAFAVAHTVDFWRPVSRLSNKKRKLAGSEYEQSIILEPLTPEIQILTANHYLMSQRPDK